MKKSKIKQEIKAMEDLIEANQDQYFASKYQIHKKTEQHKYWFLLIPIASFAVGFTMAYKFTKFSLRKAVWYTARFKLVNIAEQQAIKSIAKILLRAVQKRGRRD